MFPRKVKSRASGVAIVAMAASVTLASCSSSEESGDEASQCTIKMGYQASTAMGTYFVAQEKGFFEKAGVDIEGIRFDSGPAFFAAFGSSSIDAGMFGAPPASIALAQGTPVSIIAVVTNNLATEGLVARDGVGIKSVADLAGKKVGVVRGSSADYELSIALAQSDVDRKAVKIVQMDPGVMQASLESGDIDAAYTWQPWLGKITNSDAAELIIDNSDIDVQMPTVWVARPKWIEDNKKCAESLIEVMDLANEDIQENPGEAASIIAKELQLDEDLVDKILKEQAEFPTVEQQWDPEYGLSINPNAIESGDSGLISSMTDLAEFQKDQGKFDTMPDLKKGIDTDPMAAYVNNK